ncbi:MAG: nitroreductase family protein [Acidobacteria bacterium]|nr:nitroreductase family protein [Acidobacteriota bacterium]NIM62488.1 nitroreductase family protein [Acidobacteriota bacterium]NIO58875.1 nitroreductase family protein [Acidobacteriota bacterium]NIQ29927.1 nitroreductase family protein [Acidobacteriota bacterium]NIQ84671.1 nitroreductase family protein [Acidobacteriota bacterium]
MHPFLELIRQRTSVESFDTRPVDEETIRALVEDAACAPSSFNIQHWRFVAVREEADRNRLCRAAFGQEQVRIAPVTFIVLGDLQGLDKLPRINREAVEIGALPQGKASAWERMAAEIYADPQLARDEVLRSASLASMTLMLAAEARGLASGALSGFDAGRVCADFDIEERYLPVMLIAVGYPADVERKQQPRLGVDEILNFDRGRRF